jgi:hypothetical protein
MADLYRTIKRLPASELAMHGFRHDKLKEGFFKRLAKDRSIVFHVSGMWSYVDLKVGTRFDEVNTVLYDAAMRAGWPKERAQMFRLELVGMFWDKVGDFCAAVEDLGVYCPENSTVASSRDISRRVIEETDRLSHLTDVAKAVEYMRERSLYDPFGSYMIPGAAKLTGDQALWDWSISHFEKATSDEERPYYLGMIKELERG